MNEKIERQINSIIPTPKSIERVEGYCELPRSIYSENARFLSFAKTFCVSAEKLFGESFSVAESGILLRYDPLLAEKSYTLDTRNEIVLTASSEEGICYAISSLLQMITETDGGLWLAKAYIEDSPDKDYRALMVDLAREWHPAATIFNYIDVCFMLKVRYLHLHFIDDQAYTLPSRIFPELTKYSNHYTHEDIERFNAYAKARGVILIPEFEVPGHAAMLVKTYPEIFALRLDEKSDSMLVTEAGAVITADNIICAGSERTDGAIRALLCEICEMFPESPYIHIGGDEANIKAWNSCSECVRYMNEHGLADVYELYSEFIGRVARTVLDLGRTPIVWEGFPNRAVHHIPKETIVIAWESLYQLANELLGNGFRIINSAWQPLYIVPSYKTRWGVNEILNWNVYNWQHWWSGSKATANPINVEPTDKVLGAQVSAWECTYEEDIGRILESLSTMSERLWNLECSHTVDSFILRMNVTLHRVARLIQDKK